MKRLIAFAALVAVASSLPSFSTETIHRDAAPILSATNAEDIPNSYIVVFKKHVSQPKASEHHLWVQDLHLTSENGRSELRKRGHSFTTDIFEGIKHTYNIAGEFLGYSGHFDDDVIEKVRRHPDVDFIERDSIVHTMADPMTADEGETEADAPWGLARISHRKGLSFGTFNKYVYAADGGEGVDAYIIDTGTNIEHVDFEGRAHWGKTIPQYDTDLDGNGHGTHCSGTVAGKKYGVAKKAEVYAVKVLKSNGSGTMSDVISGVEFAVQSHLKKVKAGKKGFKGSVANMSLGGGKSPGLDAAVNGAVEAGMHFAVAAGNDNTDSCNSSPAAAEQAVTVGASTFSDERAYFSNYGPCNDIFAPGLNIKSTWIGSQYATNTISGTSMASPHIAGLLAYFLSLQPASDSEYGLPTITPKKMKAALISIATVGVLTDVPSSTKNILAWNGGGSSNFSSIIKAGSYTAEKSVEPQMLSTIEELEAAIKEDCHIVGGKIVKTSGSIFSKVEKVALNIHHKIDAELQQFVKEIEA